MRISMSCAASSVASRSSSAVSTIRMSGGVGAGGWAVVVDAIYKLVAVVRPKPRIGRFRRSRAVGLIRVDKDVGRISNLRTPPPACAVAHVPVLPDQFRQSNSFSFGTSTFARVSGGTCPCAYVLVDTGARNK